jgi:hypothetical protein
MFKFDQIDFQRIGVSAVAALLLTTVSVGAAVGPARAIEANPVYASAQVPADVARG